MVARDYQGAEMTSLLAPLQADTVSIRRARVLRVDADGLVVTEIERSAGEMRCAWLEGATAPPFLEPGDIVLVWVGLNDQPAVLLGRIASVAPLTRGSEASIPDELVIEARKNLTLRVGDGSISIRSDGKILIKGKDLVSHAQRTNRIKGGSVSIN
jgi:hypothetical protein